MNLYLVQHGQAKSKEEDPERPLTEFGENNTKKIANYISERCNVNINRIIHSGKKRSFQTSEIFSSRLKPPEGIVFEKELEPMSAPWGWVERLKYIGEDIMIVGHLPHLKRLSSLLLCQDENKNVIDFQNSGVVYLNRNESGIWSIKWIIVSSIL